MESQIKRVDDFELDGTGSAGAWNKADWLPLLAVKGLATFSTRAKIVYSEKGIYFLFDCEDRVLSCTGLKDNDDLWNEDVVEVFLWPSEAQKLYLEYELSPLGVELPLIIPQHEGKFIGWSPWHYRGERLIRKVTTVRGGAKAPGATVTGWSAEFFIPFALMDGFANVPPVPGTIWRTNFYRIDYDGNEQTLFSWSTGITNSFHDLKNFGAIEFT